ncbi:MAG: ABC transporter ATP-binding protein [Candidatus Scatosoma sp.]
MVKTMLKSVREYKKTALATPFFMVLEAVCECLIPFMMTKMLAVNDAGAVPMLQILTYGGVMVALAVVSLFGGIMGGKYAAVASCGFAKNLRKDLFYAVQNFSFKDVDKFSSSSLVTRLTTDVSNVQMAFQMCLRIVVRVPMMFIFAIIMSMTISVKLAVIYVIILPFLAAALILVISKALPLFRRIFKKYDALNASVQENVSGIRVVKSFVREDHEQEKFDKAASEVKNDFTKAEKIIAFNSPIMMLAMYAASLLITFFGAKMVIQSGSAVNGNAVYGAYAPADVSAVITYGVQMLSSLMMAAMIMVMFTMSVESCRRITEVLECKPDLVSPENGLTEVKDGSVEFENVNFKYAKDGEKFALSDINLSIKSGETVGILGGTGSSKTSLIQLIPRLYDVTEGSVKVGGVNVKDYDLDALRKQVAVVLQKNVLFSGTIKENLRWGNENATEEEMIEACKAAQADEFISSFPNGYDTYIEQGGANVSGGQKQRLCIARALLAKPKILILDDSTSAVDTKTDALIRAAFAKEIPGTTKIIIAQRVASVENADKIVVMEGGKIAACGSHEELMKTSEIYREVYESQTRGGKTEESGETARGGQA